MTSFADMLVGEIPRLRRAAMSLVRDRDRSGDLVQSTLLSAWAARDRFDGANLEAWLWTIMRCRHKDMHRRVSRFVYMDAIPEDYRVIDAPQEAAVTLGEVLRMLAKVKADHRAILTAVTIDGMMVDEAAEHLGWPMGTTQSRLARGRKELTALLTKTRRKFPVFGSPAAFAPVCP